MFEFFCFNCCTHFSHKKISVLYLHRYYYIISCFMFKVPSLSLVLFAFCLKSRVCVCVCVSVERERTLHLGKNFLSFPLFDNIFQFHFYMILSFYTELCIDNSIFQHFKFVVPLSLELLLIEILFLSM